MAMKNNKHAYLIMAHHDFAILIELLKDIDDIRNDIYLHIDLKTKNVPYNDIDKSVKHAKLYLIPRLNVRWGGYSQINCELRLMEYALKQGNYSYFHLLTGATFPLKSQDYIHAFFDKNADKEFIGFANDNCRERVEYYYLFNEIGKANTLLKRILVSIRYRFILLQKVVRYKRSCSKGLLIKKGFVYWSITENTARVILNKELQIKKWCKNGLCVDEIFAQTIIANYIGMDKVYSPENEYKSCMRECPWHEKDEAHKENFYRYGDDNLLINSDKLFALKFGGKEGLDLIDSIRTNRKF